MKKRKDIIKITTVGIIALLISLAIIPSINADYNKLIMENDNFTETTIIITSQDCNSNRHRISCRQKIVNDTHPKRSCPELSKKPFAAMRLHRPSVSIRNTPLTLTLTYI